MAKPGLTWAGSSDLLGRGQNPLRAGTIGADWTAPLKPWTMRACKSRSSAATWLFASSAVTSAKLLIYITLLQVQTTKSPHGIPTRWAFCLTACLPPMKTVCASCAKASPISKPSIISFNVPLAEATGG